MIKSEWAKDIVKWEVGSTLYLSVVFSWQLKEAELIASQHKDKVIIGGPATDNRDACIYDVLSMHNPLATFTTRGCPYSCSFCRVPKIEGELRELATWKPNPIVCDNNLLAASKKHFERVIDILKVFPWVDFNQGLDARLFTSYHADQLARLEKAMIRFAFDQENAESIVIDAITTARKAGLKIFGVYVLIGYKETPEEAIYRLEKVREWGIRPSPMRYQPNDAKIKNEYCPPQWEPQELRHTMRYYSRLRWFEHIPFEQYKEEQRSQLSLL